MHDNTNAIMATIHNEHLINNDQQLEQRHLQLQQHHEQQQLQMKKKQIKLPLPFGHTTASTTTNNTTIATTIPKKNEYSTTTATHLAKINWWYSPPQPWQFNNHLNNMTITKATKIQQGATPTTTPTAKIMKQQSNSSMNYELLQQQQEKLQEIDDGEQYSQHSQLITKHADQSQQDDVCHIKNTNSNANTTTTSAAIAITESTATKTQKKVNDVTTALLNENDDNEMQVTGFRRSLTRTIICWICICLTIGILRLVMHWWRHWYLLATHTRCSLDIAEMVLIEENYQGKHKLFYVKPVQVLTITDLLNVMRQDNYQMPYETEAATRTINANTPQNDNAKSIHTSTAITIEKPNNVTTKKNYDKNKISTSTMTSKGISKVRINNGIDHDDEMMIDGINQNDLYLTMHFTSAQFKTSKCVRLFNCKQLRYAWNVETQQFEKLNGLDVDVDSMYYHQQQPLTCLEQYSRRLIYGNNEISVPYKDLKTLLFLEVLNPFYVFQIFSVILWFTYDYYYYACVIVLMSVFGVSMSVMQTKKNQDALRATVQNTGHALVLTSLGNVNEVCTQRVVPGDIIEIPTNGCIMQCDAILLSGNCILDESMLTGESVPVTKTPLPKKNNVIYDKKTHSRHTLFCGTKVIQTRYFGSEKVLAIVSNTGNITAKGGLVRSILYPPPVDYKFEQDSYKFIECLALIALIGFLYTLVSKIIRNVDPVKIAIESLDLITIVVPPALPAAMTVGRYYAQKRLERQNIYCISPRSINVAGSINCCCFDKTGTLTEDGLDMWGVVPKSITNQFQIPMRNIHRLPVDNFLFGMATCHSITVMNGKRMGDPLDLKMFESTGWILEDVADVDDSQKYGLLHPMIVRQPKHLQEQNIDNDLINITKTVQNSDTKFGTKRQSSVDDLLSDVGLLDGETQNDHGIVREFPFTSNLQRMSVITRRLCEKNFTVYCKGSPEMLQQLCRPSTLPNNYMQQLAIYAKQGYRVIAMAYKQLSRKINFTKVHRLTREAIEIDLEFLGFVIMENRLKPDTTNVIHSLNLANIRTVMVTGDNILTALSVARDCGIVNTTQAVITVNVRKEMDKYYLYYTLEPGSNEYTNNYEYSGDGEADSCTKIVDYNKTQCANGVLTSLNSTLYCDSSYDVGTITAIDNTIMTELPLSSSLCTLGTTFADFDHDDNAYNTNYPYSDIENNKHTAEHKQIDTTTWRHNYRFAMIGDTWQIVREYFPHELAYFVARGAIFARMSPEAKQNLILELQAIDYCVAMCGDGANDCGALKVAHTGISLSETESSIASPFTSCNPTIACVPSVIKEGRAALVTSFGIFKYMAAYSMVQFISVMILYSIDSNLTDKQYLYIDLGLISVFAFFFGKTAAYNGPLHKRVPLSSLISLMPLGSLILHLLIVVVFQVAGWFQLHTQPWFTPFVLSDEEHLGCYENYTMFAISSYQYIILAFVFSKGAPYRKSLTSNLPFCLSILINLAIVTYLIVYPPVWLANFFQLIIPPTMDFRYWMLIYGIVAFIIHCAVEELFVELILFKITNNREMHLLKYTQIEAELTSLHQWPPINELQQSNINNSKIANADNITTLHAAHTTCGTIGKATTATNVGIDSNINTYKTGGGNQSVCEQFVKTPHYVELSVQQNFDVTTPTPTGLNSFFS